MILSLVLQNKTTIKDVKRIKIYEVLKISVCLLKLHLQLCTWSYIMWHASEQVAVVILLLNKGLMVFVSLFSVTMYECVTVLLNLGVGRRNLTTLLLLKWL